MQTQTTLETARGISSVETAGGLSLVVVSGVADDEDRKRLLEAMRVLRDADLSLDFLKIAPHGFSFVLSRKEAERAVYALCEAGFEARALHDRTVIVVNAPNIRDESGLVARIAQLVSQAGATIEHVGDMHSSVHVVVESAKAEAAVGLLRAHVGLKEIL